MPWEHLEETLESVYMVSDSETRVLPSSILALHSWEGLSKSASKHPPVTSALCLPKVLSDAHTPGVQSVVTTLYQQDELHDPVIGQVLSRRGSSQSTGFEHFLLALNLSGRFKKSYCGSSVPGHWIGRDHPFRYQGIQPGSRPLITPGNWSWAFKRDAAGRRRRAVDRMENIPRRCLARVARFVHGGTGSRAPTVVNRPDTMLPKAPQDPIPA